MTDARTVLTDAGYVAVGLGVMAFQQAQVRRRELEAQLAAAGVPVDDLKKVVEGGAVALAGQVRAAIPPDALDTARAVGAQLLDLVRPEPA